MAPGEEGAAQFLLLYWLSFTGGTARTISVVDSSATMAVLPTVLVALGEAEYNKKFQ